MTVEPEDPKGIAGPPVVFVPIENDGGVIGDAFGRTKLRKSVFVDVVANNGVLQVRVPVDFHRPWDVTLGIKKDVLVDPLGRYKHFRMSVSCHWNCPYFPASYFMNASEVAPGCLDCSCAVSLV